MDVVIAVQQKRLVALAPSSEPRLLTAAVTYKVRASANPFHSDAVTARFMRQFIVFGVPLRLVLA